MQMVTAEDKKWVVLMKGECVLNILLVDFFVLWKCAYLSLAWVIENRTVML